MSLKVSGRYNLHQLVAVNDYQGQFSEHSLTSAQHSYSRDLLGIGSITV
jgi:hypothetical protein